VHQTFVRASASQNAPILLFLFIGGSKMSRNLIKSFIFSLVVVFAGSIVASARTAPVTGKVELLKADGTREPVVGALVEPFRMDIKASAPSAKTNSKGEFSFAGIQVGPTYFLAVSGPNVAPTFLPNVRAGQERLLITVKPGDGTRLTEEEVRQGASAAKAGSAEKAEMTADQKKAQAEYEAKVKEIDAKNKQAEKVNEVVGRAIKEGNEAFNAKNYDLAIAKYDEGIAVDPEYVGSAPVFYNNRGAALLARAIIYYNAAIKEKDVAEKIAGLGNARKDMLDATNGYKRSWAVLQKAPASEITDKNNFEAAKTNTLRGSRDIFRTAVRTEQVDPEMIEAAKILIPEFVKAEPDAAAKAEANLIFADLYRVAGDSDNAIAAYKKILETSPNDHDALAGAGLSLVNLGYMNDDKAQLQEGANLLQQFASAAPDNHKYKADAVALIDSLKKEQNVTPQKVATPARRRN
jgi:tetratricopeptide (TPR) repeat protein